MFVCETDEGGGQWRDNKLRSLLLNDSDSPSGHPFSLSVLLICLCVCVCIIVCVDTQNGSVCVK